MNIFNAIKDEIWWWGWPFTRCSWCDKWFLRTFPWCFLEKVCSTKCGDDVYMAWADEVEAEDREHGHPPRALTPEESRTMNEAIFEKLSGRDPAKEKEAVDAVNEFTRTCMFGWILPFTRMPRRGIIWALMPATNVYLVEDLERWGWPYDHDDVNGVDGIRTAAHLYDRGRVYYELTEARLSTADYQRRIDARKISKSSWYLHESLRRYASSYHPKKYPLRPGQLTAEQQDQGFDKVMQRLLSQVQSLAQREEAQDGPTQHG